MTVLGGDLGGTNIRLALFEEDGRVVARASAPTEPWHGVAATMNRIAALASGLIETGRERGTVPKAFGLGVTGPVDVRTGVLSNPFTLEGWPPTDIRAILANALQLGVVVENDANAAALGEWWASASDKKPARLAMVTIGTGIGVGLLVDGVPQRTVAGAHGEAGHHLLDPSGPPCYCGATGCWESLASGTALGAQAKATLWPESPTLRDLAGGDRERVNARMVFAAEMAGDRLATGLLDSYAGWLGLGLVNLAAFFMPDTVIISGGMASRFDRLRPIIQSILERHSVMVPQGFSLTVSRLGDDAGMYGAAYCALQLDG